jgi:hypothetical protein
MILDVWRTFRRRAGPEPNRRETVPLVEGARPVCLAKSERLPGRQKRVGCPSRAVPDLDDSRLVRVTKSSNQPTVLPYFLHR